MSTPKKFSNTKSIYSWLQYKYATTFYFYKEYFSPNVPIVSKITSCFVRVLPFVLTVSVPTPESGQTQSKNSSAVAECV